MLMRYTAWANNRLYESLEGVSVDVVQDSRSGCHAGLIGTLSHSYAVDLIWKGHLEGIDHGFKTRNLDHTPPLTKLRIAQAAADQWYIRYGYLS